MVVFATLNIIYNKLHFFTFTLQNKNNLQQQFKVGQFWVEAADLATLFCARYPLNLKNPMVLKSFIFLMQNVISFYFPYHLE